MNLRNLLCTGLFFGSSISLAAHAQQNTDPVKPKFTYSPSFEFLRSTHGNFFNGPSFKVNYNSSSRFKLGFGIEYSTSDVHHDNGYVLYHVKFLPVYANLKYELAKQGKLMPYAEASAGISFTRYDKAPDEAPQNTTKIKENGLYLYGGLGLRYEVCRWFKPFVGVGLKGFQNSFNDLDVNPHGITFHVGVSF